VSSRQNAVAILVIAGMLGLGIAAPARAVDSETALLWGLRSGSEWGIRAEDAWPASTGAGVVVGVVDTGIARHSDLAANVLPGYDFISDPALSEDGDGRDADASDSSALWHGTHVAGAIAAVRNGTGVVGVAPDAKVLPIRVTGAQGASTVADLAAAIRWGAGLPVDGVPGNANPARVLNVSTAAPSPTCPDDVQAAVDAAVSRGVAIVVSAGNEDTALDGFYPGNCFGVVRVTATDPAGHLSRFTAPNVASNHGTDALPMTIAAPGNHILSTVGTGTAAEPGEDYAYWEGTSMAAPYVAGTLALMVQANPGLTVGQLVGILADTATAFPAGADLDGSDCTASRCGAGIADASAAVAAAASWTDDEPTTPAATEPGEPSPEVTPSADESSATPGPAVDPTEPTTPATPTARPTSPSPSAPPVTAPASPTTAPSTAPARPAPTPVVIVKKAAPSIKGTFRAGHKLTAKAGKWTPAAATASYRWLRNGKAIPHATRSNYRLTRADRGKKISVRVTVRLSGCTTLVMKTKAKRVR
jgi:serine protease